MHGRPDNLSEVLGSCGRRREPTFVHLHEHIQAGLVAHTFNPTTGGQKQEDLSESEASLVHTASTRMTRAT